jgi:hypothetical protein
VDVLFSSEAAEVVMGVVSNLWTLILVPLEMLRQKIAQYEKRVDEVHRDTRALDADIDAIQAQMAQTLTHQEVRSIVESVVTRCRDDLKDQIDMRHALIDAKLARHQDSADRIERNLGEFSGER